MADRPPRAVAESRSDWLVVVASTFGLAASVTHLYSMGMFILPLEREFGWPRGSIAGGLTVVSVISVVLAPAIGLLVDRVGSRRVAIPGMAIYCLAIALLATTTASIWHWWGLWALIAFGTVLIKPTVWAAAIAGRFTRRRGLALGLALCGTGIGLGVMPSIANSLLEYGGWRFAYLSLGAGAALIGLPMILLFFHDPPARGAGGSNRALLPGYTIAEGLRSTKFLRLALASLLITTAIISLSVHFVPILASLAVSRGDAAAIASSIGIASITGRIASGYLLDRYSGPLIAAISFGLPILACVLLLTFDGSHVSAIVIGLVIGASLGAEIDVVAFLSARYFGLRNYGFLFGSIAGLLSLGAGLGPTLAGMIYDRYGSYEPLMWALIPVFLVSAALVGSLGRYPIFDEPVPPA